MAPSNNTTYSTYNRPSSGSVEFIVGIVSFYSIVALIGIVSNILILASIIRRLVPRNTVNVFLASLAISDIIMVVLSIFDSFAFLNRGWIFGTWTCKAQSFFIEVSFTASTLTLVAVSVERYLLLCRPHMKRRTMKSIYITVISLWIGAIIICSPLLHGYIVYEQIKDKDRTRMLVCKNNGWSIGYERIFYGAYSLIIYLIPLVIMAFAHWRISRSVKDRRPSQSLMKKGDKKHSVCFTIREESSGGSDVTGDSSDFKRKASTQKSSLLGSINALRRKVSHVDKDANRRERRMKAIRLLFIVTVVFIVLWTPFIVVRLLELWAVDVNDYIYTFSEVFIFSSTAVNGFIYAFMSPPFRKAFKSILCCRIRRDISSRDSGPSMSNSEDNRLTYRMSRGSVSGGGYESRNGSISNGSRKPFPNIALV